MKPSLWLEVAFQTTDHPYFFTGTISQPAPTTVPKPATPGGTKKNDAGGFPGRGAARNMLELGKNIREGKPLAKKPPTLTVIEFGIKARPAGSARFLGRGWPQVVG